MSEGRGTTKPFTMIGSPYLDAGWLIGELEKYDLKGVRFRPVHFTPTFSKHKDMLCEGLELLVNDQKLFEPVKTGHILLHLIKKHHPDFEFLPPAGKRNVPFIDLISGTDHVREHIDDIEEVLKLIERDTKVFAERKRRYHIYE